MLGHFWWDARRRFVLAAADAEVIVHPGFPTAPVSLELFILFAFGWLQHTWLHWKCCWYADKVQKWAHSAMGLVGDACRGDKWFLFMSLNLAEPPSAWSGSPTHLLLEVTFMAVGEPDYPLPRSSPPIWFPKLSIRLAKLGKLIWSQKILKVHIWDFCDKNVVNLVSWGKKAAFSIPATKMKCFHIVCVPHLHTLLLELERASGLTIEDQGLKFWKIN